MLNNPHSTSSAPSRADNIANGYAATLAPPGQFSLERYRAALREKWWLWLLTVFLCTGAATVYLYLRPIRYYSKAAMWGSGKMRIGDVAQYNEDAQNYYGTQIGLFTSDALAARALNRLKSIDPGFRIPVDDRDKVVLPAIKVEPVAKSAVFNLEATSTNADYAQRFLNALIDEFLAYKKQVRAASSGSALASISEQVFKQERELKQEQERFSEYQRTNNVALLQEQATGGGSQLALLDTQLGTAKLELQMLDASAMEQSIGRGLGASAFASIPDVQRMTNTATVNKANDFLNAKQQVEALRIQRDQLGKYLRSKHPKIIRLSEQIAFGEQVLEYFKQQNQEQLATMKAVLQLRVESIRQSITNLELKVGEATRRLSDLELIKNNITRQQSLYDRLLTLLQSVDINTTMDQENISILERAGPPLPANGSGLRVLVGAIFVGNLLGIGLLCLVAKLDDRCDTLEELRNQFDEEILGQIPEVKGSKGRVPLLQAEDERHVFGESCRNLRSLLTFRAVGEIRPRMILVTSAVPDEGKTTIAINLARVLAIGGAKTLLVEADLRRGRLHKHFDLPNVYGLSNLLYGQSLDEARAGEQISAGEAVFKPFKDSVLPVLPTDLDHLFLLPRGTINERVGELFLKPAFDKLLQDASNEFEYVIFDSIPVFAADDATAIAAKMDAVLFLVRGARTSSRLARHALELLYQRQAKVLGIIFNRTNTRRGSYAYYKYGKYYSDSTTKTSTPKVGH